MSVSNSVFVLRFLIAQELIASFSTNAYRVRGPNFARNAKSMNCVLYAILARTENLHFAVNGRFMHSRSHFSLCLRDH